jgi:hypothetical protein
MEQQITSVLTWLLPLIIFLAAWELVWKTIALWKSARSNQLAWFICIAVFNTAGILPIIYILMHRKKVDYKNSTDYFTRS